MPREVWDDIRSGLRSMTRHRGFAATAILILALGIGSVTAIFSAVSSVLLAPLPFPESDDMVRVLGTLRTGGREYTGGVAPRVFHELRERSSLLESVAAQRYRNLTLTGAGETERIAGIGVSDGWMETVGVRPILGRGFTAAEEAAGSDADAVVIAASLWHRRFAGDEDVLGQTLTLDGRDHVVVGVMPPGFRYPYNADLWMPMTFSREVIQPGDLNVPARLREGVTTAQIEEELRTIGERLAREAPGLENRSLTARPFAEEFRRDPDRSILALFGAVAFLLLIGCVNVANLQLARGESRRHELAVRASLGASRFRQVRELFFESLVLALVAGALGSVFALGAVRWLDVLIPSRLGEVVAEVEIDGTVLLFALGASVLTAIVSGLAPAFRLSSSSPSAALRSSGTRGTGRTGRLFRGLVVVEIALAVVLLTGAALMARNVSRLLALDVGYEPEGLVSLSLGLPQPRYDEPARRIDVLNRVTEGVRAIPEVGAAGITTLHPIPRTTTNTGTPLRLPGADPNAPAPVVNLRMVSPSYFETLGLATLAGTAFDGTESRGSSQIVAVSRSAAERFWPEDDPVGNTVRLGAEGDDSDVAYTVVGVVADIAEPDLDVRETVYRPYAQGTRDQRAGVWSTTSVDLLVRSRAEAAFLVDRIRETVREVDPTITVFDVAPLDTALAEPLTGQKLGTLLVVGFGAFGLLLSLLGIYSVLAFSVRRNVPELGIRLALGMTSTRLFGLVLGKGMALIAGGLVLGALGSLALARVFGAVVTEVDARDPATIALVAVAIVVTGLLACGLPARRAATIDPVSALDRT